jgi:hypothetical protein
MSFRGAVDEVKPYVIAAAITTIIYFAVSEKKEPVHELIYVTRNNKDTVAICARVQNNNLCSILGEK